jgi:hypothetical protein
MAYSVRCGKLGFECDVCGVFVGDIRLIKSCYSCHRVICPLHTRLFFRTSDLPPQFRRYRKDDGFRYACPDCDEERQRKEQEEQKKEEKRLEEESQKPITTCQICGADDSPPDHKIFGNKPPEFMTCDRCGRLGCDNCISGSPEGHYEYDVICRECYQAIEQEEAREREEHWREEEENKIEE